MVKENLWDWSCVPLRNRESSNRNTLKIIAVWFKPFFCCWGDWRKIQFIKLQGLLEIRVKFSNSQALIFGSLGHYWFFKARLCRGINYWCCRVETWSGQSFTTVKRMQQHSEGIKSSLTETKVNHENKTTLFLSLNPNNDLFIDGETNMKSSQSEFSLWLFNIILLHGFNTFWSRCLG